MRVTLGASRAGNPAPAHSGGFAFAAVAGALGLLGADGLMNLLTAAAPEALPRLGEVGLDWSVAIFAVLLSGVTVVLASLVPAIVVTRRFSRLSGSMTEDHERTEVF
jgi:putative ABC transport system permease protein